MRLLLPIFLFLWVQGAGAADRTIWNAKVDVQIVALSPKLALTLLPQLQRADTSDAAVEEIQAMIADGEVELLGWPVLMAQDSQTSTSTGVEELQIPDYEPQWSSIPQNSLMNRLPSIRHWLRGYSTQHWNTLLPPSIETRNLGPTLEIEPSVNETGSHIAISIFIQDVDFGRNREQSGTPSPGKIAGVATVTEMRVRTLRNVRTVRHGKRVLLASYVEQEPAPRVVLYLLRAKAVEGPIQ